MANYAKYTKAAIGHLFKHYERAKDKNGDYVKFKNQDINPESTPLNYNLGPHHNQLEFIHKRLSEVYCFKRKDVNVMCSWVITAPRDLPKEIEKDFFKTSYEFLSERYGFNNVISSYVHLDEKQPHMHFCFIPVVYDRKKNREKVSAKECVTRVDLQVFHTDLQKYLEEKLKLKINILNATTENGNKAIYELKREGAIQRIEKVKEETSNMILEARKAVDESQLSLLGIKAEYDSRIAFIEQCVRDSDISVMYPNYVKVNKSIFGKETVTVPKDKWEKRHVSANQISAIREQRMEFDALARKLQSAKPFKEIESLKSELQQLKNINRKLKKQLNDYEKTVNRVNLVFEKKPEIAEQFFLVEKELKVRERGMNR